jgi:hypothetical protein
VSRITPQWNSFGLEELTDYTYEGEVKSCTEKLLKVYEKQFNKSSQGKNESRSNRHNKENQIRKRSSSNCNRIGKEIKPSFISESAEYKMEGAQLGSLVEMSSHLTSTNNQHAQSIMTFPEAIKCIKEISDTSPQQIY